MCSCGKAQRQIKTPTQQTLPITPGTQITQQDQSTTIRQTLSREEFRKINFERKQIKPNTQSTN